MARSHSGNWKEGVVGECEDGRWREMWLSCGFVDTSLLPVMMVEMVLECGSLGVQ